MSKRNRRHRINHNDDSLDFFTHLKKRLSRDYDYAAAGIPRARLANPRDSYPHPFEAFDPAFCKWMNWQLSDTSQQNASGPYDAAFLAMIRPASRLVSMDRTRVAAVDGRLIDCELERTILNDQWSDLIDILRPSLGFVGACLPIWRKAGLTVEKERSAFLMQMDTIDEDTSTAVQAAMFMTWKSSPGAIDMEALAFGIAAFVHSHPYFQRMATPISFPLPYGDHTAYVPIVPIRKKR